MTKIDLLLIEYKANNTMIKKKKNTVVFHTLKTAGEKVTLNYRVA